MQSAAEAAFCNWSNAPGDATLAEQIGRRGRVQTGGGGSERVCAAARACQRACRGAPVERLLHVLLLVRTITLPLSLMMRLGH